MSTSALSLAQLAKPCSRATASCAADNVTDPLAARYGCSRSSATGSPASAGRWTQSFPRTRAQPPRAAQHYATEPGDGVAQPEVAVRQRPHRHAASRRASAQASDRPRDHCVHRAGRRHRSRAARPGTAPSGGHRCRPCAAVRRTRRAPRSVTSVRFVSQCAACSHPSRAARARGRHSLPEAVERCRVRVEQLGPRPPGEVVECM
jgi:hypothetical protein